MSSKYLLLIYILFWGSIGVKPRKTKPSALVVNVCTVQLCGATRALFPNNVDIVACKA